MAEKAEDVVTAATQVFARYGYKRVTMADLAEAANLSRPSLYLVFPSKEQIFKAVVARVLGSMLADIRQGLSRFATVEEKLTFACEIWCVGPFEMIRASPDTRDLLESSYEFASEISTEAAKDFVSIVAEILDPLTRRQSKVQLSSTRMAQLLASALLGFKASAETTVQLRALIAGLITVLLASLGETSATAKRGTKNKAPR